MTGFSADVVHIYIYLKWHDVLYCISEQGNECTSTYCNRCISLLNDIYKLSTPMYETQEPVSSQSVQRFRNVFLFLFYHKQFVNNIFLVSSQLIACIQCTCYYIVNDFIVFHLRVLRYEFCLFLLFYNNMLEVFWRCGICVVCFFMSCLRLFSIYIMIVHTVLI